MKFMIEIEHDEIARVVAFLGRPLQVTPVIRDLRPAPRPLERPQKRKSSAAPILRLIKDDGPTGRLLAFAKQAQAPFTSSQARDAVGDKMNKDSFYSTLDRLARQGILDAIVTPGERKHYALTEVGKNILEHGP